MSKNYCDVCGSLLKPDNSCSNCNKFRLKRESILICSKCGTEIHFDESLKKRKKIYILRCVKCKTILKGKKLIIARNLTVFSGLSATLILGIFNAKPDFKAPETIKVNYTNEKYNNIENNKRFNKLEEAVLNFSKAYNKIYSSEIYSYQELYFSNSEKFKNVVFEEIKKLKLRNIKTFIIDHSTILNDNFDENTNIGLATIKLNGSMIFANSQDKIQFNKEIEFKYEYEDSGFEHDKVKNINFLKYSVLSQNF